MMATNLRLPALPLIPRMLRGWREWRAERLHCQAEVLENRAWALEVDAESDAEMRHAYKLRQQAWHARARATELLR